jgi:XTP/dITP diphosphohydrolase
MSLRARLKAIFLKNREGVETFNGIVSLSPKGDKTFAELGEKKNEISMRKIAFNRFREFLQREVL